MKEIMSVDKNNIQNVDSLIKKVKELQEQEIQESRKTRICNLDRISLSKIANNEYYGDDSYMPYLFDFSYILDRIKNELSIDNDTESLQIKIDISSQLSKMKEVPSLKTECHIESRYINKCTSIKSYIMKKLFGQKKYRLVFHKRQATFEEEYYKKKSRISLKNIILYIEIFCFVVSNLFNLALIYVITVFAIIITLIADVIIKRIEEEI